MTEFLADGPDFYLGSNYFWQTEEKEHNHNSVTKRQCTTGHCMTPPPQTRPGHQNVPCGLDQTTLGTLFFLRRDTPLPKLLIPFQRWVVSTANCVLPKKGSPSKTTSSRLLSPLGTPTPCCGRNKFVATRPPASLQTQTLAHALSRAHPFLWPHPRCYETEGVANDAAQTHETTVLATWTINPRSCRPCMLHCHPSNPSRQEKKTNLLWRLSPCNTQSLWSHASGSCPPWFQTWSCSVCPHWRCTKLCNTPTLNCGDQVLEPIARRVHGLEFLRLSYSQFEQSF